METQFIIDLHEKSHKEFIQTYGEPVSLGRFMELRAHSADAYLNLYLGTQQVLVDNDKNNVAAPLSNTENLDGTLTDPNGRYNQFVGHGAGSSSVQVKYSTFIGYNAGQTGQSLSWSVFIGSEAGKLQATGTSNVIIGALAASTRTGGGSSVLIGYNVNNGQTNGTQQVVIGADATASGNEPNQIVIGAAAQGFGQDTTVIGTSSTDYAYIWAEFSLAFGTPSAMTKWHRGSGSPEGVVTGRIGDFYSNLLGGASTTFYVKTSGNNTNTGWTAK